MAFGVQLSPVQKTSMCTRYSFIVLRMAMFFSLLMWCQLSFGTDLPDGLSVIGLEEDQWNVYVAENGQFQPIAGIDSPRTAAYHHGSKQLAFIGADGKLMLRNIDQQVSQELLAGSDTSRFTQPHFSTDGNWLFAVELPGGKSRRTNIIGFDLVRDEQHGIVRKRTAQFEPFIDNKNNLYYTTAICVDDCDGMIWELWRRNLLDGKQEQLTLLNALSSQPHISEDGWLYFTSNRDGGRFHIWRMLPNVGAKPQQLTDGNYRDSDPTTSQNGDLYFLRKSGSKATLMHWKNNIVSEVLTPGFVDMRNLETGR